MAPYMDALGELPSGSDSDGDEEETPAEPPTTKVPELDYETLKRNGYAGARALTIPEKANADAGSFQWSRGRASDNERDTMSREELRAITHERLHETCASAIASAEENRKRKELDRAEREEAIRNRRRLEREARDALAAAAAEEDDAKKKRHKSWNQKEKKKRAFGQAKGGGGDWVQEEKRLLRGAEGGGGFGFD